MAQSLLRYIAVGFVAGALGVLLFHQIVVLIFYELGLIPFAPYSLDADPAVRRAGIPVRDASGAASGASSSFC